MVRILISPNSFKTSLSSIHAALIIRDAITSLNFDIETIVAPIAEGLSENRG